MLRTAITGMMKKLLLLLAACAFAACTTVRQTPSFGRALSYLDEAESNSSAPVADSIRRAKQQIEAAQSACDENTRLVDEYAKEISILQGKADYWKQKQRKALKELWVWRGAFIAMLIFAARGPILFAVRKIVGIPW